MARRGADVLGIDLAAKPLKVAQLHAHRGGAPRIDYREVAAEALRRETPGALRRRHLHGDARARARSRRRSCAPARRLVKPGGWVFFSTINRNPKAFVFAIVGAEYVLRLLPEGHARVRAVHPAERAGALVPRGRPRAGRTRGMEYNPLTRRYRLSARHQRELPGRLPQAGMTRAMTLAGAVLFDLDGTLVDSAPDLAGACNDMRAQRGLAPLPFERAAPMVGSGARGMVGVAFGVDAGRRRLSTRCATSFSRATKRA